MMAEKRFWIYCDDNIADNLTRQNYNAYDDYNAIQLCDLLNELHEENQALQRHIKRNTFNKIRIEDILNCAKYDKFYDDKEAIKSIDWIAKQLGVDLE